MSGNSMSDIAESTSYYVQRIKENLPPRKYGHNSPTKISKTMSSILIFAAHYGILMLKG